MTDTTPPTTDTSRSLFLARYATRVAEGMCTAAEQAEVERWTNGDAEREAYVASLVGVTRLAKQAPGSFDAPAAWTAAVGRLGLGNGSAAGARQRGNHRGTGVWHAKYGMATVAAVVLGICVAVGYSHVGPHGSVSGREYVTKAGQRLSVTLVDGTRVTLAPESRLRIPRDYARGVRMADLDGEGYFAVVHDATHPFTVRARGTITRDVGTAFDVRAYPEDAVTRVAVVEGAVMTDAHPLLAGDVARIGLDGVMIQHQSDVSRYVAWMQGTLVFEETPLRDVTRDISRAFGVTIIVADSTLLPKRITGTLSNKPLDFILDVVTQAVGARYERTTHGIVIRSGVAGVRDHQDHSPMPLTTAQAGEDHK